MQNRLAATILAVVHFFRRAKALAMVHHGKTGNPTGRPPYAPTEEARNDVKALASCGVTQDIIARYLHVAPMTLRLHFPEELDFAAMKANQAVAINMFRIATRGNGSAAVGEGMARNYAEAMKWFRKAAEQDVAQAQYSLGVMYVKGEGVTRDYAEAVKCAEQGYADAENNLGLMYAAGDGVPRDYVEAYKWLSLAAAKGNDEARDVLNSIEGKITPDQIAEAQKRAAAWKAKEN
jgi:TPR repeat protein